MGNALLQALPDVEAMPVVLKPRGQRWQGGLSTEALPPVEKVAAGQALQVALP